VDAFERVVVSLLEREGFWVRSSFKVELTKDEKVNIGRPSSPRWELDVVGYRARDNELRVVECKSYLDSRGVAMAAFDGSNPKAAKRFKLFAEPQTRAVVLRRLEEQLLALGAIRPGPRITLCLAAGRIVSSADVWRSIRALAQRGGFFGQLKRETGSHKTLAREGCPDFTFAFHDSEEIGPRMLARIAKRTGLTPNDL